MWVVRRLSTSHIGFYFAIPSINNMVYAATFMKVKGRLKGAKGKGKGTIDNLFRV